MDHRAFFVRVVHDGTDAAKYGRKDPERNRRIALGGGNENRPRRDAPRTVKRVVIAVAEEQDEIERAARNMVDERAARRPFAVEPGELIGRRVRVLEDPLRTPAEVPWIALAVHGKPPYLDAVHGLGAGRELVAPGDVIAGTRRDDFHVRVARQTLGDVSRVQLGAAVDVSAVALYDNRESHDSSEAPPSP